MRRNHLGYRVGEGHQKARLSDAAVKRMREMRAAGLSYEQISSAIGCSKWTTRDIVTYRTRGA